MRVRATILALASSLGIFAAAPAQADERSWLAAHNAERTEFGVAPLEWSRRLEREALEWYCSSEPKDSEFKAVTELNIEASVALTTCQTGLLWC